MTVPQTPQSTLAAPVPHTGQEFQTGRVLTIVGGHFVNDVYTAFLSPMLPLLIEKLSLSFTLAGTLSAVMQLPALLNPFLGYLADRVSLRYFVIFAPAITASLISCLGLAPNYGTLAILLLMVGISNAAFHAPAPPMIARISGKQVGKGMSFFMAGGELGRTLGPLLAVWAFATWTLEGYWRIMLLGWAATLILYWRLRDIPAHPEEHHNLRAMLPAARRLFIPLTILVFLRAFVLASLSTFLPVFMQSEGAGLFVAGAALSIYEVAGVVGALSSGMLSDRFGHKPVLLITMFCASLLMLLFLRVGGWLIVPVLLALGFAVLSASPVLLAMVQEHMPHNRATANGLFMTISFLARPTASVLIGVISDSFSLRAAFTFSAFMPLLGIPVILWLPQIKADAR